MAASYADTRLAIESGLRRSTTPRMVSDEAPDSLRIDIPKDDVPAENKRMDGMKYLDLDVEGKLEMKPIVDVIEEALAAIKK